MFGGKNTEHTNVRGSLFTVLRLKCQEGAKLSWPLPLSCLCFLPFFSLASLLSPVYFILYNLVYIEFSIFLLFIYLFIFFMILVMLFVCSILLHGFFAGICFFFIFFLNKWRWDKNANIPKNTHERVVWTHIATTSIVNVYERFLFICIFQYWVCIYGLRHLRLCVLSIQWSFFSLHKKIKIKCSRIQKHGIFTCTKNFCDYSSQSPHIPSRKL